VGVSQPRFGRFLGGIWSDFALHIWDLNILTCGFNHQGQILLGVSLAIHRCFFSDRLIGVGCIKGWERAAFLKKVVMEVKGLLRFQRVRLLQVRQLLPQLGEKLGNVGSIALQRMCTAKSKRPSNAPLAIFTRKSKDPWIVPHLAFASKDNEDTEGRKERVVKSD